MWTILVIVASVAAAGLAVTVGTGRVGRRGRTLLWVAAAACLAAAWGAARLGHGAETGLILWLGTIQIAGLIAVLAGGLIRGPKPGLRDRRRQS